MLLYLLCDGPYLCLYVTNQLIHLKKKEKKVWMLLGFTGDGGLWAAIVILKDLLGKFGENSRRHKTTGDRQSEAGISVKKENMVTLLVTLRGGYHGCQAVGHRDHRPCWMRLRLAVEDKPQTYR